MRVLYVSSSCYSNVSYPQLGAKKQANSNLYDTVSFKSKFINKSSEKFTKEKSAKALVNFFLCSFAALALLIAPKRIKDVSEQYGYKEPLQEQFGTKEEAIDYAIDRIRVSLNADEPKEYGVNLDYDDYSVISEKMGDDHSVSNYPLGFFVKDYFNIDHPYISLHGHPEEMFMGKPATQTFSFQDFRSLVLDHNKKESFVINKDGKFCVFRKKEGFQPLSQQELEALEKDFEFSFRSAFANPVEVYKGEEVVHTFYDYQGMHAFWKRVADKHNLEYYTNYGVHKGVDAYKDYYYPELMVPQAETSHKDFKL